MKKIAVLAGVIALTMLVSASTNINSTNNSSWGANIGWMNWQADGANGAVVGDYVLGGFIYGANVGWINLGSYNPANHIQYQNNSATDFGVNLTKLNASTATLRGFAWGANIGWINFEDTGNPTIDLTNRQLHGYAWGANVGWINLGEMGVTLAADSIAPGIDTDGNGIPDAYEQMNFGTVGVDPNADPDADGLTNSQEAQTGSNPNFPDERLLNISTRLAIQTGDNVLIGGFIITGNNSKRVIVRGLGPSLGAAGVQGALDDPTLELHSGANVVATNDNWQDNQTGEIQGTGIPPTDPRESAIVQTLDPGEYTAVLSGSGGTTGVGLVEAFDLDQSVPSKLANISTRGFVGTQDSVLIGGFIIGPSNGGMPHVIVRAIGPSLTGKGVQGALDDPMLELHDGEGNTLNTNDDWQQNQQAEIEATGVPPTDPRECAIVARLAPGNYTGVVRGKNDATGIGLVEVFNIP
jgi:hypothetical protein